MKEEEKENEENDSALPLLLNAHGSTPRVVEPLHEASRGARELSLRLPKRSPKP